MTQFKDSRVVAAFNKDRLQYQYMVGNEQRLTGLEDQITALSGLGSPAAILSAIAALQASDASQNANISTLFSNDSALVSDLNNTDAAVATNSSNIATSAAAIAALQSSVLYSNYDFVQKTGLNFNTASTTYVQIIDSPITTIGLTCTGNPVFFFVYIGSCYLTPNSGYCSIALRLDSGSYDEVIQVWNTTDGPVSASIIYTPAAGYRVFSAWLKTGGGTTANLRVSATFFAIEL